MTIEKIETLPKVEKTFWKRAIKVDPKKGLTPALVKKSKSIYGNNILRTKNSKTLLVKILERFKELIVILLTIAAVISLTLGIITVSTHSQNVVEWVSLFVEFVVIVGIIFTDIFLSLRQSDKTDKALETLKKLSVPVAKVIRGGKVKLIPSSNIVPGDIMVLEAGEAVPADGKLIESSFLQVDESVLTGESIEVEKDYTFESNDDMQVGDRKDCVFSGTNIVNGTGLCRVMYTGMNTQIGNIASLLDSQVVELTPLQKQVEKLSKIIGIIAISVCLVTFVLYMVAMTGYTGINFLNWSDAINVSVTLAIASIPETLLAVVTIILSISVQALSKQNALIKQLPAVETLGSLSVVCTDKTGTLTKNVMTVSKVWNAETPLQTFSTLRAKSGDFDSSILKYGTLCSDAKVYKEKSRVKFIGDSTETAILKGYVKLGGDVDNINNQFARITDIPFDADRKMMSVIVPSDNPKYKYMIITKGAPDYIFRKLTAESKDTIKSAKNINEEMSSNALRVLAVAIRYIDEIPSHITSHNIEHQLTLVGLLGINDPPRPEALVSVKELRDAGIRTIMITGDHKITATAIAKELKILRRGDLVLSGNELKNMTDEELTQNIEKYSVYARVSPAEKLRIVNAWKANGKIVSMTGDGVNDAPSLKAANIGCAMGINGTDVAKDASAMVLMDDNFATIVRAVDVGRRVMLNIKSALTMLLTANVANLLCILLGILIFGISPLQSLQILTINVAVETTLSFAIASNKRQEPVMSFMPRNPKQFIIDRRMIAEIFTFGIIIGLASLVAFYVGFSMFNPYQFNYNNLMEDIKQYNDFGFDGNYINAGSYEAFRSYYNFGSLLSFLTIGITLSINGLYARESGSIFTQKFSNSKNMLLMVLASLAIVFGVSFIPGVNDLFNMGLYTNPEVLKYFNYSIWLLLPFVILIIYIALFEIYRLIFNLFFNSDGSRKVKAKVIEEDKEEHEIYIKKTKKPISLSN